MTAVSVSNKANVYFLLNPHIPAALKLYHVWFLYSTLSFLSWPTFIPSFCFYRRPHVHQNPLCLLPGLILEPHYWSLSLPFPLHSVCHIYTPARQVFLKYFIPFSLLKNQSLKMKTGNDQNEWWHLAIQDVDNESSLLHFISTDLLYSKE